MPKGLEQAFLRVSRVRRDVADSLHYPGFVQSEQLDSRGWEAGLARVCYPLPPRIILTLPSAICQSSNKA